MTTPSSASSQAPASTKTPSKEAQSTQKSKPTPETPSRDQTFLERAEALEKDLGAIAKDLGDTYYTSAFHACHDITVHLKRRINEVGKLRR